MEEGNVIRTLLIEGDLGNAEILREMLAGSSFGRFELIHCQRFEIGMSRLAGGDIDVVLLDLSLQDIDGFEALSQLRSQMPQVPVVALGEVDDRAIALRALEGGAQDYWVKDKIVADLMIRSLRYAIERHRSQMRAEQSRRDERLIRANRSWKMLSECNQALIWASDESNLLDEICRIVVETGGYRMAWIGYAEHDGEKTVKPMAQKGFDDGYLESVKITWDESETGRGPTGTAIRTGAPCLIRDILHDPSYRPWRSEAIRRGYQSSIALPLIAEERVLGALNIYATEPDAFDEDEVALLMRLADNLAYGIETLRTKAKHDRLREELVRKNNELLTQFRIIRALLHTWDLDERVNLILDEAMGFADVELGWIYLVEGDHIVMRAWRGISDDLRVHIMSFHLDEAPDRLTLPQVIHERIDEEGMLEEFEKWEGIQTLVSIPLTVMRSGGEIEWLGTLVLASRWYEAVDRRDIRALQALSEQLALAIDHVRRFRKAEERLTRLTTLRDIDRAIISRRSIRDIVHTVLDNVPGKLGADAVALSMFNGDERRMQLFAMRLPNGTIVEEEVFSLADSLLHWFVDRQEPVIIYDLTRDPRLQMHHDLIRDNRLSSYLGVPLVVQDKTVGVLHLLTTQPKLFSTEDVDFFRTLAGQVAIALENARLFQVVSEEARLNSALLRLEMALSEATGVRNVCERTAELIPQLFSVNCFIFLWDGVRGKLIPTGTPSDLPELPYEKHKGFADVICKRETVMIEDITDLPCGDKMARSIDARSIVLVPLIMGNELLGVTCVCCSEPGGFSKGDVETIEGEARRICQAIVRERARERAQLQLSRLELLSRIVRSILELHDLESILRTMLGYLEESFGVDYGCVLLYDELGDRVELKTISSKTLPIAEKLGFEEGQLFHAEATGLRSALRGKVAHLPDLTTLDDECYRKFSQAGIGSMLIVPMITGDRTIGLLVLARREANAFEEDEIEFLRRLSEYVALAVYQTKLHLNLESAYEDLRQAQEAMMQQERLKALGQMASGIAHDINNALAPVIGFSDIILRDEPNLSDNAKQYLRIIRTAGEDIVNIVSRMREFYRSRDERERLLPVDLNRMAEQVVELTRPRWRDIPQERGIMVYVNLDLQEDLPHIMGIESEIREAMTNLVINAVDAMPEGGRITIRTRSIEDNVLLEVSDTGMGMDEETRRRCLEPFYSTKGDLGTGLGLAMVYGTMQRHEGDIEIESELGKGTTMRLIFPVRRIETPPREEERESVSIRPLKVLVIDDEPLLRRLMKEMLEGEGHTVETADGGEAGLNAFRTARERGEPFDLIITDLGMPYMDGRTVARTVKGESPETTVIMMTGWGARMKAGGEIPAEVDAVLNKPPRLTAIQEMLARFFSE